jgi:hypothetical protein
MFLIIILCLLEGEVEFELSILDQIYSRIKSKPFELKLNYEKLSLNKFKLSLKDFENFET